MTHSYGVRSGTRYKFARAFRERGLPTVGKYLETYKRGEYVVVKANGAVQKGMPYQYYHGRTGRVFDVTRNAVGVEMTKLHRGKLHKKRIHIRREHVFHSRCREDFLKRKAENAAEAARCKAAGERFVPKKRMPAGPEGAKTVIKPTIVDFSPIPFSDKF